MFFYKEKPLVSFTINTVRTTPGAMLIDCRPKEEFSRGHVSGAVNIPLDKITENRILKRIPDQEKELYIIGSYTSRPGRAVEKLKELGYKNVHEGGFMNEHHGLLVR